MVAAKKSPWVIDDWGVAEEITENLSVNIE